MAGTSIIDRILKAIDKVAKDYGEWTVWGSSMAGDEAHSGDLHHEWNAESGITARVIIECLQARGMAVKPSSDTSSGSTWIHIEKRRDERRD